MAILDTETTSRVDSPCVRKCTLDDDDVCVGCYRSLDEICAWGGASDTGREEILYKAAQRRERNARHA